MRVESEAHYLQRLEVELGTDPGSAWCIRREGYEEPSRKGALYVLGSHVIGSHSSGLWSSWLGSHTCSGPQGTVKRRGSPLTS